MPQGLSSGRVLCGLLLLGHYLFFTSFYRYSSFSARGVRGALPSSLWSLLGGGTESFFFLSYPHTKALLFLVMMTALSGIALCFVERDRAARMVLALVTLTSAFYLLGEMRLWQGFGPILLLLSGALLLSQGRESGFRVAFSLVTLVAGVEGLFGGGFRVDWAAVTGLALSLGAVALWSPSRHRQAASFLGLLYFLGGWLLGRDFLVWLALCAGVLAAAPSLHRDLKVRTASAIFFLWLALLLSSPTLQGTLRPWQFVPSFRQAPVKAVFHLNSGAELKVELQPSRQLRRGRVTWESAQVSPEGEVLYLPGWFRDLNSDLLLSPPYLRLLEKRLRQENLTEVRVEVER